MIIGITGTDGSGKGSVVDYLVSEKGYRHYSVRELITEEIKKRGLDDTRANLRLVGNTMRAERGADVMVQCALEGVKENNETKAVVESIRALKEVETLKKAGGILLAVDAPVEVRYERIVSRGSGTDKVSLEDFQKQEALEMNDTDPNGMQKAKVMSLADYTIANTESLPELFVAVDSFLDKFSKI